MKETAVRRELLGLFAALRTGNMESLERLSPDASLRVSGRGRLAGLHRGPLGLAGFLRARREGLDEFEAFGEDVAISAQHAILLHAIRARRGEDRAVSHEAIVAHHEHGRLGEMFLYVFDPAVFDRLWG